MEEHSSAAANTGVRGFSHEVPHHARGARSARQEFRLQLAGELPPNRLADVVTIAGELLGNAVRHARPLPGELIRLEWRIGALAGPAGGAVLEIRVTDGGATTPPNARAAAPDAVDGRGLAIVAALADRWGVHADERGQCVWAEIDLDRDRGLGSAAAEARA